MYDVDTRFYYWPCCWLSRVVNEKLTMFPYPSRCLDCQGKTSGRPALCWMVEIPGYPHYKEALGVFRTAVCRFWSLGLQIPCPERTFICYPTSHNKALPFSTNRAHRMHMDSLANQRYSRCHSCAIKTDKNTHPCHPLILNIPVKFSLG